MKIAFDGLVLNLSEVGVDDVALVERGISSISLNPDTVIQTTLVIAEAEAQLHRLPHSTQQ